MDSRLVQKLEDLEIPLEEWPEFYAIECGFWINKIIEWNTEASVTDVIDRYFFLRLVIPGQNCVDSHTLKWFTWHCEWLLLILRKQNPAYSLLELVDPVDYFKAKETSEDWVDIFKLLFKKVQAINVQSSGI
jgi:predicted phosphoadenosine phosphosulfate sulfurtransferase